MPTACATRCPDALRGDDGWLPLLLFALIIGIAVARWWWSRHAMWIPAGHPLLREAQRKALGSLAVLQAEHAPPDRPALVKLRADTDSEVTELVWAELLTLDAQRFTARILTPPRFHAGPFQPDVSLPLERLLDWQVVREDGTVRGGFSVQAEIRLRRQAGRRLSPALAELSGRFVDG